MPIAHAVIESFNGGLRDDWLPPVQLDAVGARRTDSSAGATFGGGVTLSQSHDEQTKELPER